MRDDDLISVLVLAGLALLAWIFLLKPKPDSPAVKASKAAGADFGAAAGSVLGDATLGPLLAGMDNPNGQTADNGADTEDYYSPENMQRVAEWAQNNLQG